MALVGVFFGATRSNANVTPQSGGLERIGSSAQPVRVLAREVPLFASPEANSVRRGTLGRGALATVYGRHRSSGCSGEWLLVGAAAWTCNAPGLFELRNPGDTVEAAAVDDTEFARISINGAIGYSSVEKAEQQLPDAELQPGFFVGLVEEQTIQGETYARTTHDIWIAKRQLIPLVPSSFEGAEIESALGEASIILPPVPPIPTSAGTPMEGYLPLGWLYVEQATPYRTIQGAALPKPRLARLTRVRVLDVQRHSDHHEWYRIAEGWLSDRQLRVPTTTLPPSKIGENERWIDVDKRTQTLVAYVGRTPVFATLVSTGRGSDAGPTATPVGDHRIWVKLTSTDMDNLEEQKAQSDTLVTQEPYAVEAVPFVMYFLRGYGLHATYWHDAFGTPRSHGCVNLSHRDAARLFEFSSPRLAPGWQAVHPFARDPGTLVRVR